MRKDIEKPIYVDRIVEVPVERIVERRRDVMIENPVYVDKVIEVNEADIGKYRYDRILPTEVKVFEQPVYKEIKKSQRNIIERPVEV